MSTEVFDAETLGTIAQLGLGLAGFSGIALVLTRGGAELSRLEVDRLGIMLGSSLGASFLGLLPLVIGAYVEAEGHGCRIASGAMAVYTAGFLRYYVRATLRMRAEAPELVTPLPFGSVTAGHAANLMLQIGAAAGLLACVPVYLTGLTWLLFHGAYQFGRILFIRPRARPPGRGAPTDAAHPEARESAMLPRPEAVREREATAAPERDVV